MTDRPAEQIPYDLEAEESLLGACLLSREAITAATSAGIEPGDFYKPSHALIYVAVLDCHAAGEHADPVVIANRLNGSGAHLGGEGGASRELMRIQGATPASANANAYARIVADTARRRRLMDAASQLRETAREGGDAAQSLARLTILTTPATPSSGLTPIDLAPILAGDPPEATPTLWRRNDGQALIYAGKITSFHAEPTGGKTMLALHLCTESLLEGRTVIYVDLEADPDTMVERLRAIGVADHTLNGQFLYIRPDAPFTATDRLTLIDLARSHDAAIVVFDTLASLLALHGISEDDNSQVLNFLQTLGRPIARTGAALIILDHVIKNKEDRGRWARGAGAKLGEQDAAYELQTIEPFSRTRNGIIRLKIAKDRFGGIGTQGEIAADFRILVNDYGHRINITCIAPSTDQHDPFTPTRIMDAISRHMETMPGIPLSKSAIEQGVNAKAATTRAAIRELVRTGHIKVERGPRGALQHTLITPYRQPDTTDEPPPDDPGPELEF